MLRYSNSTAAEQFRTAIADRARVHPYQKTVWVATPRNEIDKPTAIADRDRVLPYEKPVWVTTPRHEIVKPTRQIDPMVRKRRRSWSCRKLSDLEIAGIIFALIGLTIHIVSMATVSWASHERQDGDFVNAGIFPQCQHLHGCLPMGPVGAATIVALIYGVSVPVLFVIYTTCCWRRWGGRYLEYATAANCFVATLGVLAALLLAGLRLWGFPMRGFQLDYSYYLDIGAGFGFLISGILFLAHVCLQWN
ncbi:uncharacterized protein [Haliotis cracherodii]|uniref:uncharacterized protein n=1 Tax=Haliotis cracherodii TaxID=6455 RepID=UPI0039E92CF4